MSTRELSPIDASISEFHDEEGDEDDTANQMQRYVLLPEDADLLLVATM